MPWILNENNQFEYRPLEGIFENTLQPEEMKDFHFLQDYVCDYAKIPELLEAFIQEECLKPISFNITKSDGTREETTLTAEETRNWLFEHKNVLREAGREPYTHLFAFAIKNGLRLEDFYLLKDHPDDKRCDEIRKYLDEARKEMFELVGSEDTRIPEGSDMSVRESKLADFFADYFIKVTGQLDVIKQSAKTDSEKTMEFANLFKEYHSLVMQTLGIGDHAHTVEGQIDGKKIIPFIDKKLTERGAGFSFEDISNFGRLSQLVTQPAADITRSFEKKEYENDLNSYRKNAFVGYARVGYAMSYLSDNVWSSGRNTEEIIKICSANGLLEFIHGCSNIGAFPPGFANTPNQIAELMEAETLRDDLYLDSRLLKFADQTVPYDFEEELYVLADSFGGQHNMTDPGFNDMITGLNRLALEYDNPQSDKESRLIALRYAQQKAADYLDSHPDELSSDKPSPSALLAEKIFTLAGTQKLAVRADLQPGAVLIGSRQYNKHDLSIDALQAVAPIKLASKALKTKHFNKLSGYYSKMDVLPDAGKHIKEEVSADYSVIDEISNRENVPVHDGLEKKNGAEGGYTLEFVCTGSSSVQSVKAYGGQAGQGETIEADRPSQEITDNTDYMVSIASSWLAGINEEYRKIIADGRESELKPVNINFEGRSKGGVAVNEASLMVNQLIDSKYPQLREFVHISSLLMDPMPGLGADKKHPGVDLNKGNYRFNGKDMRGLKASAVEQKNNASTVFYGIHANKNNGYVPQSVVGADRVILSLMPSDIYDSASGQNRGYLAENGEVYKGAGFNELGKGLYFIDENKNLICCRNSQEAHKAIDAMLGKHAKHSRQWSRHGQVHDMVDAWFKSNPEVITSKDTRYPLQEALQADIALLQAADTDEMRMDAMASLFSHQLLLNQMNEKGKRFYPESPDKTRSLLAKNDASGVTDKIRQSYDFEIFFEGLNNEDIQAIGSGDTAKLNSYITKYKRIEKYTPELKEQVRKENQAQKVFLQTPIKRVHEVSDLAELQAGQRPWEQALGQADSMVFDLSYIKKPEPKAPETKARETKPARDTKTDAVDVPKNTDKTLDLQDMISGSNMYETLIKGLFDEVKEKDIDRDDFLRQVMTTRRESDYDIMDDYDEKLEAGRVNKIKFTTTSEIDYAQRRELSELAFRNYCASMYDGNNVKQALRELVKSGDISPAEMKEVDHSRDFVVIIFEFGDTPEAVQRNKDRAMKYLGKHLNPDDPEFETKKLQAQAEVFNDSMKRLAGFDFERFKSMDDRQFVESFPEYYKAAKALSVFAAEFNNIVKLNPYINKALGQRVLDQEENYGFEYMPNTSHIRAIANPIYEKLDYVQFENMGNALLDDWDSYADISDDVNIMRLNQDIHTLSESKAGSISERINRTMNTENPGRLMKHAPLYFDDKGQHIFDSDFLDYANTGKTIYAAKYGDPDCLAAFRYDQRSGSLTQLPEKAFAKPSVIDRIKTSAINMSEEEKFKKLTDERKKAEDQRNKDYEKAHEEYYKDRSERYEELLNGVKGIRQSLTHLLKELHEKNLSVEKYADDFAYRLYNEAPKIAYDEFCNKIGVPDNEKIDQQTMDYRKALSAKAAKAVFSMRNDEMLGVNFEAPVTEHSGIPFRTFSRVMCDPGQENFEKNKKAANILINGTIEEKKKLIEDRFTELMNRSDKLLGKSFTDEELIDHMGEISNITMAAALEMDGFYSGLKSLEERGLVIDKTIRDRMDSYKNKLYQYSNFYFGRIDYIASKYYQYGAEASFVNIPDLPSLMVSSEDTEFTRTIDATYTISAYGALATAERLFDKLQADGRKIENFYDLSGKSLGTLDLDIGTKYYRGGEVIVCYEGDPKPQKIKLSGMNTFFPDFESAGELSTEMSKVINAKRFDDKLDAIESKDYDPKRKAFEEAILNDQYKLALCMGDAPTAKPENSSHVRDIAAGLMAKLSIKKMIEQAGSHTEIINELISDASVEGLKANMLKNGLASGFINALPHDMDSMLALSADKLGEIFVQKNEEYVAGTRNQEKDPLESFLYEKLSKAAGAKVDPAHFEETLDRFVTYGDDNNRNLAFNGKNNRISQIKSVIENGGKVFITIPDKTYHTKDVSEIVLENGQPKLHVPKLEHDAMMISVRAVCNRVNAIGEMQDSPEFEEFKQGLNDAVANGIPKETDEYFKSLSDLCFKAYNYSDKYIDKKTDSKQNACVTASAQMIEIYRAVCDHEKPTNDSMNLTIIGYKYLKSTMASNLNSPDPKTAATAREILGDSEKCARALNNMLGSKSFKSRFANMSSKELETFAQKQASEIVSVLNNEKQKTAEFIPKL